MGRILTITNSNELTSGVKKKTIREGLVIGPNAIKFVTIAIFAILALVFLTQSTAGVNRSVKVRDLNTSEADLKQKVSELEVEKQRLRSLGEIDQLQTEEIKVEATLEPISKIDHIGGVDQLARN